ncbi:MAG: carboxypeptidase-like regulatory domain-containing protein [Planctomycetota bacterium]
MPGRYAIGVSIDDRSFVDLGVRHRQWVEVSAHEATEVPDFRLERGRIISGRVVDPAGEAVADAWISAQWTVTTPEGQEIPRAAAFRSDARGSFLLAGLPGGQEVELTVHHRVAVSSEPTSWRIGSPGRLTVQVQPHVRQPLTGRVTRSNGTPVDRARIEVWTRPIGQVHLDHRQVDIASDQQIATDASGAFVWAELLPVDAEYRVVAYPRGEAPFAGEWFAGEALPQAVALTLPTLQSLTGQVVDPEGVPVEGAWIIQAGSGPRPARARSDETGSFEIGGFTARSGLVFAERDGVTFGRVADGKLHLILEPGRGTRALQGPGVEVARDLVPRLLEPSWETALSNPTDPVNLRTFSLMARVDPARVFELIESDELPTAQQRDFLRVALAQYWLLERPDDAHRLIEEAESAEWQTAGLVAAARSLPADEVQGKASLLEKAQALLPKVDDGASRLMRTATVAQEWWAIGEHDRARSLLSEGQKQAARLAPDDGFNQFARGTFASRLARTDLEAALALVGDGAPAKDAYLGEMAVTLAEDRIGDAERVFRALGSDSQRHRWIGELARVMAPRDLIRTRRLIESLGDSGQRAGALAVCAEAVLPYSSERAESLLGEAFDELDKVSISNDEMARVPTAAIGAALLPIAERVAPERVSELLVRSLALRRPVPWPAFLGSEVERLEAEASLALFVARYDGELARALLDDVVSAAGAWIDEPGLSRRILEARTILSPSEAFDSLEREQSVDIRARQSVADLLTTPADEKWQDLRRRHLGLFW